MGKEDAFSCQKGVSLAGGTPYLLKRTQPCAKRAPFRARRAPMLAKGALCLLKERCHW